MKSKCLDEQGNLACFADVAPPESRPGLRWHASSVQAYRAALRLMHHRHGLDGDASEVERFGEARQHLQQLEDWSLEHGKLLDDERVRKEFELWVMHTVAEILAKTPCTRSASERAERQKRLVAALEANPDLMTALSYTYRRGVWHGVALAKQQEEARSEPLEGLGCSEIPAAFLRAFEG